MLFSVGAGGAPAPVVAGVVAGGGGGGVVSGAFFSSLAQPAVIAPIAMTADRPEIAASLGPEIRVSMVQSYLRHNPGRLVIAMHARRRCRRRGRIHRRREQVAPCGVDALLRRRWCRRRG